MSQSQEIVWYNPATWSTRRQFLTLFIIGLVVYSNSLRGDFHFDDHYNIRENLFVHDLTHIPRYFVDARTTSSLPENAPYRPLSTVSFALLWAAGGGDSLPYHLFKMLAHLLVAWFGFLIARRLMTTPPNAFDEGRGVDPTVAAFCGALLFVVHPCLSEAEIGRAHV